MFLHLGKNVVIHLEDVIAIIDLGSISGSGDTGDFISIAREEGFEKRISDEQPKSMVITEKASGRNKKTDAGNCIVYFSPISSTTLSRRASFMSSISDL